MIDAMMVSWTPMTDTMANTRTDPITNSMTYIMMDPMNDSISDCMIDTMTDPITNIIIMTDQNCNIRALLHLKSICLELQMDLIDNVCR